MPEYDFNCLKCQSDFTLQYKSFTAYSATLKHLCIYCKSDHTVRKIGRVALGKGAATRLDELANNVKIDENDPNAIGNFYKRLGEELGTDISSDG